MMMSLVRWLLFLGLTWERVSRVVTGGFDAGTFLLSEFLFLER